LPVPFGLVRFGVAPDHGDTKAASHKFERLAADARVGLLCGVEAGRHLPLTALRSRYHAVVLAHGAPAERPLGVPGESLPGCLPARAFVEWYNGHPDAAPASADVAAALRAGPTALVLGLGNVAVDCARMLLRPPSELAGTDIAAPALEALRASAVRRVLLVGRRGPAQASFTPKELRELLGLPGVHVTADEAQLTTDLAADDHAELATHRPRRRALDEIIKATQRPPPPGADRELRLLFLRSPAAVLPADPAAADVAAAPRRVGAVRLQAMRLEGAAGARSAVPTGAFETLPCSLVLSSIGYRGAPLPEVPFHAATGTVPSDAGAVRAAGPGLYAAGWAKRGPTGIIGTNLQCAEETVATLAADVKARLLPPPSAPGGVAELARLAREAGARPVSLAGWLRIDAAERAAGAAQGRPRDKATDWERMLQLSGEYDA
jgi:adrenodoxin-NADP+ reductase